MTVSLGSSGSGRNVGIFTASVLPISETFIRDQARLLHRWNPTVFGFQKVINGLDIPNTRIEIAEPSFGRIGKLVSAMASRPFPRLIKALKLNQIELVHAHFGTNAVKIWPSVCEVGLPMVVSLHGYDIHNTKRHWHSGRGGGAGVFYPARLLSLAEHENVHFVAVSESVKQRAIQFGIPESKITKSYIGVDTEKFRSVGSAMKGRVKQILFVGRMVEKKAPILMIEAFSQVSKSVHDAELVMIGDGPLFKDAQALARRLRLPVRFLRECKGDEVCRELNRSRVFCLPSVRAKGGDAEGLPISILEAMACGVPVVTSALGAVNEAVFQDYNGITFQENHSEALSDALTDLLVDEDKLERFGAQSISIAQGKFNIRKLTPKLEKIYDTMLRN